MTAIKAKPNSQKLRDQLSDELMSVVLHLRVSQLMMNIFRENPIIQEASEDLPAILKAHVREVNELSERMIRKVEWFTNKTGRLLGDKNAELYARYTNLSGDIVANICNLTGYVVDRPRKDINNQVDLLVNAGRRKEMFRNAWRVAIESEGRKWNDLDTTRFDAWYNTQFHH